MVFSAPLAVFDNRSSGTKPVRDGGIILLYRARRRGGAKTCAGHGQKLAGETRPAEYVAGRNWISLLPTTTCLQGLLPTV